jgi:DNA-binding response OmpR family regulator
VDTDVNKTANVSIIDSDQRVDELHAVDSKDPVCGPQHKPGGAGTEKLRVLICEDDDDFAVLSEFFLLTAGFEIEQAEDAETAWKLIRSSQYDIMILDLGLPGMDGLSFIRELDEEDIDIPVIVISINASKARDSLPNPPAFIVDWIDKPLDQQQLVNSVLLGVQPAVATGRRILHIEDDPDIIHLVQVMLDDTWEVIPAASVCEGRSRLTDGCFDLVLLDINLPDGSGLDLLPDIRALQYPVAVFSEDEPTDKTLDAFDATIVKSKTTRAGLLKTLLDLTEAA